MAGAARAAGGVAVALAEVEVVAAVSAAVLVGEEVSAVVVQAAAGSEPVSITPSGVSLLGVLLVSVRIQRDGQNNRSGSA